VLGGGVVVLSVLSMSLESLFRRRKCDGETG
jgi:hypothetical protein